MELCTKCKQIGYCRIYASYLSNDVFYKWITRDSSINNDFLLLEKSFEFGNSFKIQIPLKVTDKKFNTFTANHLQTGFDAFHQNDFETAYLHFKAIENEWNTTLESYIAVTLFFMQHYKEALESMQKCINNLIFSKAKDWQLGFCLLIENRLKISTDKSFVKTFQQNNTEAVRCTAI